ncbi:MAG: hypothetical protein ACRD0J_17365 [Acidimicrobiales bacterium]
MTAGARSEAEFSTDRGQRVLPAWRLEADDVDGPIWVLDPDLAVQAWEPEEPPLSPPPFEGRPHRSISAVLGPDGRTLAFHFTGAPPLVEEYPRAEVVESAQAVTVAPVARDIGPPGPRALVGSRREVVVELEEPLGTRVLVDLDGSPAEVIVP